MKCKTCGQDNPQHINFCINCGDPIVTFKETEDNITLEEVQQMNGTEYLKNNKKKNLYIFLLALSIFAVMGSIFLPFKKIDGEVVDYTIKSGKVLMGAVI